METWKGLYFKFWFENIISVLFLLEKSQSLKKKAFCRSGVKFENHGGSVKHPNSPCGGNRELQVDDEFDFECD